LRVHLPGWHDEQADWLKARLREVPGVKDVQANPLTANVLIRFDQRTTGTETILAALQPEPVPQRPRSEGQGHSVSPLLQVGIRGLLGHAVVDAAWFGAGFLGRSAGLPLLAWLGPLHVVVDVMVWGAALASVNGLSRAGKPTVAL